MNKNVDHYAPTEEVMLLEDEMEDEILARALEESLRHYKEVELPFRQSQLLEDKDFANPGSSRDVASCSSTTNTFVDNQEHLRSEPLLYKGKDAEGFDLSAGRSWVYPTNYPVRQYQFDIVKSSLFKNTLVSLPTGLGKTFIAAVVMYNFYRWFPKGKVIFMAPTKPLVHQQIDSCYKVMGIPKDDTAEMTGTMLPAERATIWEKKRVFFLTPHVLTNDLTCGTCPMASIKCVVIDEAHKALGSYSYCQVIKALLPFNRNFRVLALSATPGSNMQYVIQVVKNLLISHVELRNEDSPDIVEFTHKRNIQTIVVKPGPYLSEIQERFMLIVDRYIGFLLKQRVLFGSIKDHSKFGLLKAREAFRQSRPSHIPVMQYGSVEANFAICITLSHSLELLSQHGLRSFYKFLQGVLDKERGNAVVQGQLILERELVELLDELKEKLGPNDEADPEPDISLIGQPLSEEEAASYVYSHPKIEKLREVVVNHFTRFQEKNVVTRVMIFCQYRDTVNEVCHVLRRHHPLVKPMTFVGQSTTGKQSKGFTQKQQIMVMEKFRVGGYNTLVSTCVGEEGLDIGEVDLIVCFDAHNSPVRLVQRMGRTGRKREGRIVMLVTEGKEQAKFKASMCQNNSINKELLEGNCLAVHFYNSNPRMVPLGINPQCHQMYITVPSVEEKETKRKRNQDIRNLLGKLSGARAKGSKNAEATSPYCTADELAEFWDGTTIPAYDRIPDLEEFHAKGQRELREAFSIESLEKENEESHKLDLKEWLEWQRYLQPAVVVKHSDDSRMLVELLEYAESKRCSMQPTQTAGLLSQVNTSLMWPKRKSKGKGPMRKRVKNAEPGKKKTKLVDNSSHCNAAPSYGKIPFSPETDGEGNPISGYFQTPAQNKSRSLQPETLKSKDADFEVIELVSGNSHSSSADQERASVNLCSNKDVIDNNVCYFCKSGLFYCHHILSCTSSKQYNRRDEDRYVPLDFSSLKTIDKESLAAFDLRLLITPPSSPRNEMFDRNLNSSPIQENHVTDDIDPEIPHILNVSHTLASEKHVTSDLKYQGIVQNKSPKTEIKIRPNFDLNFVFEPCLFEEEILPNNGTEVSERKTPVLRSDCDYTKEMSSDQCDKDKEILEIKRNNDVECTIIGYDEMERAVTPDKGKELLSPKTEIKSVQESPEIYCCSDTDEKFVKPGDLEYTPKGKTNLNTEGSSNKEIPDVMLSVGTSDLSPISPILCSLKPVRNGSMRPRKIPMCSTPKLHKKSLFSNINAVGDQDDEGEIISFHPKKLRTGSLLEEMNMVANNEEDVEVEEILVKSKAKIPNLPKANFHLVSPTQFINDLLLYGHDEDEDDNKELENNAQKENVSLNNTKTSQNFTMCTVTQLLNMIDNKSDKTPECEKKSECATVSNQNTPRNEVKYSKCSTTDKIVSSETAAVDEILIENEVEKDYFNDSDDIFADLALECNNNVSNKKNTSTSSMTHGIGLTNDNLEIQNSLRKGEQLEPSKNRERNDSVHDILNDLEEEDTFMNSEAPSLITMVKNVSPVPGIERLSERSTSEQKQICSIAPNSVLSRLSLKRKLRNTHKTNPMENILGDVPSVTLSPDAKKRKLDNECSSKVLDNEERCEPLTHIGSEIIHIEKCKKETKNSLVGNQTYSLVSGINDKASINTEREIFNFGDIFLGDNSSIWKGSIINKKYNHTTLPNEIASDKRENDVVPPQIAASQDEFSFVETKTTREATSSRGSESVTIRNDKNTISFRVPPEDDLLFQKPTLMEKKANFSSNSNDESLTILNSKTKVSFELPTSEDDSPIIKAAGRNRRANISSTSNESLVLSPNKITDVDFPVKSVPVQSSGWLNSEKSNTTSAATALSKHMKSKSNSDDAKHRSKSGDNGCTNLPTAKTSVIEISSDDDSDFQSQPVGRRKIHLKDKTEEQEKHKQKKEERKKKKEERKKKKEDNIKKSKNSEPGCAFVDLEAEESGSCPSSSDGEDTSGLDDYDSSFVSESGSQTQTEIQARFLESMIRSPRGRQGQFKMPTTDPAVPLEAVFSQEVEEFETSYLEDSFCVDEDPHTEVFEASALEVAEAVLEAESKWKRRKRKRKRGGSGSSCSEISEDGNGPIRDNIRTDTTKNKKRRRILTLESSESESEERVNKMSVQGQTSDQALNSVSNIRDSKRANQQSNLEIQNPEVSSNSENRAKPVSDSGSKSKNKAAMSEVVKLDFCDWDDDDVFDIFVEKRERKTTVSNKVEDSILNLAPTTDKQKELTKGSVRANTLDSAEKEMDDLVLSPVLSQRSKKSFSKAARSLSTDFNREAALVLPSGVSCDSNEMNRLKFLSDNTVITSPAKNSERKVGPVFKFKSSSRENKLDPANVTVGATTSEDLSHSPKVVIMATRQVACAPEIATALRSSHNVSVLVRSVTDADYVVSWRLGVLRVPMSDFVRAYPSKSGLTGAVKQLRSAFMKQVLVAENDKHIPVTRSIGTNREIWSKTTATQVAYLRQAGVSVLFSCDKADTARLVAMLANLESTKNQTIIPPPKDNPDLETRLCFYQSLPCVNIALAMRLCHMFPTVVDFMESCSSVRKIQEVLGLDCEKAARIQLVLRRAMRPQQ